MIEAKRMEVRPYERNKGVIFRRQEMIRKEEPNKLEEDLKRNRKIFLIETKQGIFINKLIEKGEEGILLQDHILNRMYVWGKDKEIFITNLAVNGLVDVEVINNKSFVKKVIEGNIDKCIREMTYNVKLAKIIEKYPGWSVEELMVATGKSEGKTREDLKKLREYKLVIGKRSHNKRKMYYFPRKIIVEGKAEETTKIMQELIKERKANYDEEMKEIKLEKAQLDGPRYYFKPDIF